MKKALQYRNIKKLWASHLKLAILDYYGKDRINSREAGKYINSSDLVFPSFCSICEMFDINPESLRKAILRSKMRKKDFRKEYTFMCCECGKRYPATRMHKLDYYGMYLCSRCHGLGQ